MVRFIFAFFALLVSQFAHADWAYEFLHVTCTPDKNYFEARVEILWNLDDIYWEFDKKKQLKVVQGYAKKKSLYLVDGYEQRVSCDLLNGMKIRLSSKPNPQNEHDPYPGAGATLTINNRIIFSDLGFPSSCRRMLDAVSIFGEKEPLIHLKMRYNEDFKPEPDLSSLPIEITLDSKSSYNSEKDIWLIKNCLSPIEGSR